MLQTIGTVGGMVAAGVAAASLGRKRRQVANGGEELDALVVALHSGLEEFITKMDSLSIREHRSQ